MSVNCSTKAHKVVFSLCSALVLALLQVLKYSTLDRGKCMHLEKLKTYLYIIETRELVYTLPAIFRHVCFKSFPCVNLTVADNSNAETLSSVS